jgi:hypothetical protein
MQTVEGRDLTAKELSLVGGDETPTFAARPTFVTVGRGQPITAPLLLLTSKRLVIARDKIIGKLRADYSADWSDVLSVAGQLWRGSGPQIELLVRARPADLQLVVQAIHAVDIESAIRHGYLR